MGDIQSENRNVERITMRTVFTSVLRLFNIERGLLYTIKELLIRPGKTIRTYLYHDRKRLSKPFGFLILIIAIATYLSLNVFDLGSQLGDGMEAGFKMGNDKDEIPEEVRATFAVLEELMLKYYNLIFLSGVPIIGFFTYLFFRKQKWNYAEHLVISSYTTGLSTFMYIVLIPSHLISPHVFNVAYMLFFISYSFFAYKRIFERPWPTTIFKTMFVLFFYFFFVMIITAILLVVLMVKFSQNGG